MSSPAEVPTCLVRTFVCTTFSLVPSTLNTQNYVCHTLQVVVLLTLAEVVAAPVGPFIDSHVQHQCKKVQVAH